MNKSLSFSVKIVRRQELTSATWSGGTTTQLAIYPPHATYANRDFTWRISTATIEVEESTFTPLPNIHRILMILEGKLQLKHEGHYEKALLPFQQGSFMGDWNTNSKGKVVDFNLMMSSSKGCKGFVNAIEVAAAELKTVEVFMALGAEQWELYSEVFYFLSAVEVELPNQHILSMAKGDVIVLQQPTAHSSSATLTFRNTANTPAYVIQAGICHNC